MSKDDDQKIVGILVWRKKIRILYKGFTVYYPRRMVKAAS